MKLHSHLNRFGEALLKQYGRVDISYQIDQRYDASVLLKINSSDIKEEDIVDELLKLFHVLGEEDFGLVILDNQTLLTFDSELDIINICLDDTFIFDEIILPNNNNIVNVIQIGGISSCEFSDYTYNLAA